MSLSILAVLSIFFISYFSADAHSAYAASPGLISGTVFIDSNLNGIKDGGESGKSGWQITLTGTLSNGTAITPRNVNSNSTGGYAFNQLLPGTYTLTEADVSGWVHTSPKIITSISIGSGTVVTNNFGNVQLGTITARLELIL
ncbi:MAG: hypothetical protein HY223_00975 [Thaumarchaeota archaeon]|nr:hypothetical protein [Nitrososphaerota archaeon]